MLFRKDTKKINFKMLAKVMGWLLMIESGFMALPAVVGLCYGEADWQPFAIAALLTLVCGFSLNKYIRPSRTSMAKREGFLLTASVWVVFSLFGMLPFVFCSSPLSVGDAFFEAMSGFTTTGASSYADVATLSHAVNFWRALMQWIGGMGIILFTLAVLPMLNSSGGMQMFNAEVTGITHEKIQPRISQTAKGLWSFYFGLTAICFLLLWAGPMDAYESLCHAFGTLSTGGFSTRSGGPASWDSSYVDLVITVFMFLGGTSFTLVIFIITGRFSKIKHLSTFMTYAGLVAGSLAVLSVCALAKSGLSCSVKDCVVAPLFQIVSTVSSSGFAVPGMSGWAPLALSVLACLMVFGGCAGSTSGGAKIERLIVLVKFSRTSVRRALQPNSVTPIKFDGRVMPQDIVTKTIAFLCCYALVICAGALILAAWGAPMADSLFTSASCMSNYGVSAEAFGGSTSITALPAACKLALAAVMLIGRLEVFTILIIFTPAFWHR